MRKWHESEVTESWLIETLNMSLILPLCFTGTLWCFLPLAIHSLVASASDAKELFEHLHDIIRVVLCHDVYVITQSLKCSSTRWDIIFFHLIFAAFFCGKELRSGGTLEVWGRGGRWGEKNEDVYLYVCLTQKPQVEELS